MPLDGRMRPRRVGDEHDRHAAPAQAPQRLRGLGMSLDAVVKHAPHIAQDDIDLARESTQLRDDRR